MPLPISLAFTTSLPRFFLVFFFLLLCVHGEREEGEGRTLGEVLKRKPLLIGVPGRSWSETLVNVTNRDQPTGFCIKVFEAAVALLEYDLTYHFEVFNGTYHELVDKVHHREFDAVVGDVTILANRSKYVDFTQPYAEVGLSVIIPRKSKESENMWMFVKPFNWETWSMTGAIFVYTTVIVWLLERGSSNPEFGGSWKSQLGTALWFTYSTLFFAHRERIKSRFSQTVIAVWLLVIFVMIASYQASLTTILTVQRLEPTMTDISLLRRNNSKVVCNGDSFVKNYLIKELQFKPYNIKSPKSTARIRNYADVLKNENASAAFILRPFQRKYLTEYCPGYEVTGLTNKFGGLGFVFPKGSDIAKDISRAILNLSEKGNIAEWENELLKNEPKCLNSDSVNDHRLNIHNFWGLFLVTGGAFTIVFLLHFLRLIMNFQHPREGKIANGDSQGRAWTLTLSREHVSEDNALEHPRTSPRSGFEIQKHIVEF